MTTRRPGTARAAALAAALSFVPLAGQASPVTYTLATQGGTGSLGSAAFNQGASIIYTATADTADLQEQIEVPFIGAHGNTFYGSFATIQLTSLTIAVGGLPSATVLTPPKLRFVWGGDLNFTNSSGFGYVGFPVPTPPVGPDVLASSTAAPIRYINQPFTGTAATTQGVFSLAFTVFSPVLFSADVRAAAPVPEPGTAALAAGGLLCLLAASWRRPRGRLPRTMPGL